MTLVVQWTKEHKSKEKELKTRKPVPPVINKEIPWDYFDVASQGDPPLVGSGGVLYLLEKLKVQVRYAPGHCTNNKAKLVALHAILELAVNINVTILQVFGETKMVVDWVNNKIQIKAPHLQQLLKAIRRLLNFFLVLNITHVYRELNMEEDNLSKLALLLAPGHMETEEVREE